MEDKIIKEKEREHMNESEAKFKHHMEICNKEQIAIKAQVSKHLKQQISDKVSLLKKKSSDHTKSQTGAISFLRGMACPHGKMYVCAFCARDQQHGSSRKGSHNL